MRDAPAPADASTCLVQQCLDEADRTAAIGDLDASCFWLTHAWIEALAAGLPIADDVHTRLAAHGRA